MDELTRLALAAGNGDRVALAAFIRASQAEVWRLCAHLVDRQSADDLTQEVYVRAIPALARFRGDSSARTWLLSIARHTCMDALRRIVRHRKLVDRITATTSVADATAPEPSADGSELDDVLDRLDADRRSAFVLTQTLGLSYSEAAEVCGVPIGTIRSRVARARSDLIDALAPLDAAGDADHGAQSI